MNNQARHEIEHGRYLATVDTDMIWGWGSTAGRTRARRRAMLISEYAHLHSNLRVLEIGCGTGIFTEMFAQTGAQITAVDISAELIEHAKQRCANYKNVTFIQKQFEECLVDGPFDAVIGSSILHHLAIDESLGKIFNLLKPKGVMSFAEPNMLNPQVFMERKFRRFFSYVSQDETAFIKWRLKKILKEKGYQDIQIKSLDWLHPLTPEKMINSFMKIETIFEKTPIIREFSGSLYITALRP